MWRCTLTVLTLCAGSQPPSLLWDQLQEEPFEEEEFSDLFARQVVQKKPVKKKEVKSPKKQVGSAAMSFVWMSFPVSHWMIFIADGGRNVREVSMSISRDNGAARHESAWMTDDSLGGILACYFLVNWIINDAGRG